MPHRPTKSRLMRRASVWALPPICRSKLASVCQIAWLDCADDEPLFESTTYDLDEAT